MPVEVKEIVIRAIVQEEKERTPVAGYTEALKGSAEEVLKIIEKKKER